MVRKAARKRFVDSDSGGSASATPRAQPHSDRVPHPLHHGARVMRPRPPVSHTGRQPHARGCSEELESIVQGTRSVGGAQLRSTVSAFPTVVRANVADIGPETAMHWVLRMGCVAEYLGHGALDLMTKAAWMPYFATFGIPTHLGWMLMPIIGVGDISLGLIALCKPIRAVLLYMALWGLWTAVLRPLSGEPIWEMIERFPNFLVPAAFLY